MKDDALEKIRLYLITDDLRSRGRAADEVVAAAVRGGVKMVQYRPWKKTDDEIFMMAEKLREITAEAGCMLLINGRPEVAKGVGADGIHTGDSSISVAEARKILSEDFIIGYSAHSPEGAVKAREAGADFVTFSPLFPTTSNSEPRDFVDQETVSRLSNELQIPLFALGGIGLKEIPMLKKHMITRVAVVSAITESEDIESATKEMLLLIGG